MKKTIIKGFTLTEVMIVVAIIGVMAAIAIPNLSDMAIKIRANSAAREIFGDLYWARTQAIKTGRNFRVDFNAGAGSYTITNVTTGGVERTTVLTMKYPGFVFGGNGVAMPITGDNPLVFRPNGRPSTTTGSIIHLFPGFDSTVRDDRRRRVVVEGATGRVRIEVYIGGAWTL
jgi:prepilin-type N-terminal cleavage/methylation domain-containing protein